MSEVTRAIDTPRGVLLVTVKRVTDPFGRIDHDDLRRAARVLLAEAAVLSEANEPWTECEAGHRRIRNGESHIVP